MLGNLPVSNELEDTVKLEKSFVYRISPAVLKTNFAEPPFGL